MTSWIRITLIGATSIIAFDTVASFASRMSGVTYSWASAGSWILYAGFGYLAARSAPTTPVQSAALMGFVLGLTDLTAGWAISWAIGPGRMARGITLKQWGFTAVIVTVLAVGVATLGSVVGRRIAQESTDETPAR